MCVCVEKRVLWLSSGSRALFMGPTNLFFSKIFIKNESHDTIHTFTNYFITIFSVFNNKQYPNVPLTKMPSPLVLTIEF